MKKFFISFFIAVVMLGVAFSPVGVLKVSAQEFIPYDSVNNPSYTGPAVSTPGGEITQGGKAAANVNNPLSNPPAKEPQIDSCITLIAGWIPSGFNWDACLAAIMYHVVMRIVSWVLFLAGLIFDASMYFTIHISDLVNGNPGIPVVTIGWRILRDLANVFFIFILLWIAISTILGLNSGKTKELMVHLIVVALLMNFSLFITQAVIDASNIVAVHFYNLVPGSYSGAFMDGLKIQTLYDGSALDPVNKVAESVGGAGGALIGVISTASSVIKGGNPMNMFKIVFLGLFGSILMLTAAYVFLVAAILFLIRTVVLMFVMLLSPLGFLAFALPATEQYGKMWRDALIKQSFFAPAFMVLSYVVVRTIQSPAFQSVMSITTVSGGWLSVIYQQNQFMPFIMIIVNFLILIGLMLGCILIAKKLDAVGVDAAVEIGKQARGFVGRHIMRGSYLKAPGTVAEYGGAVVGRIPGLKNVGDKIAGWGKKGTEIGEKLQKKGFDINELDKKFRQSKFGATELGSFIQEKTTGGKLFGVGATFGGEKTVGQSYEESEHLKSRRFAIEKLEGAEEGVEHLEEAEENRLAEAPDWKNRKYRDVAGKFDQAKFDTDFQKWIDTFEPIAAAYAPHKYDEKYYNPDGTLNQALFDKDTAAGKTIELNKKYRNPDGSFKQALFDRDVVDGKGEFTMARDAFNDFIVKQPHRASYLSDEAFGVALKEFQKRLEEPEKTDAAYTADPALYEIEKKIAKDRTNRKEMADKAVEAQKSAITYNFNQVAPDEFANMHEDKIKKMAPYANLSQLKAVMKSEHWTVPEKQEMLDVRWRKELNDWKDLDDEMVEYNKKVTALKKAAGEGLIEYDRSGEIISKQLEHDGKKWAQLAGGGEMEVPEPPKMPKHLREWGRNKMTEEEYKLAALIVPEMFQNPTLVQMIRWPLIFKNFRTDESMPFSIRDGMTYLKDAALDPLVNEDNPNYLEENTPEERKHAFEEAVKEAAKVAPENKNKVFIDVYNKFTQKDLVRDITVAQWQPNRANNEIPRGKFRNSHIYHHIVNEATGQQWADKDAEDAIANDSKGKGGLLTHALMDFQAEKDGQGVVSEANRAFLRYIFNDPRSAKISRSIGDWDKDLQDLYRELYQKYTVEKKTIEFPSDKERGLVKP